MRTFFKGLGMYVPPNVVDNHRLARLMDTSDAWIQKRTGIVTRRYADPEQGASDMAVPAARAALENAGIGPDEVDYVIFATMTPDFYFPGSAPLLQQKLGLPPVACLDIRQQCSGFLYGMQLADSLVRSGCCGNVLLVMHQANLRINEAVQKRLGLPDEKVYNNIQKYGNTTAATLPLAFYEARSARSLSAGSLVCFVALGSGLTWGAALYRCP